MLRGCLLHEFYDGRERYLSFGGPNSDHSIPNRLRNFSGWGMDIKLPQYVTFRPIGLDRFMTRLQNLRSPNGSNQHMLMYRTGLDFTFGRETPASPLPVQARTRNESGTASADILRVLNAVHCYHCRAGVQRTLCSFDCWCWAVDNGIALQIQTVQKPWSVWQGHWRGGKVTPRRGLVWRNRSDAGEGLSKGICVRCRPCVRPQTR
jgi:hypothetical protein